MILILIVYGSVEGVSALGLRQLSDGIGGRAFTYYPADTLSENHRSVIARMLTQEPDYTVYSSILGWTIKPDGVSRTFHGKRQGDYQYQANSQGIRSDREYSFVPQEGIRRVATFGDSLTHCDDVANADTWQAFMTESDPALEVINFGVGGFGLDQSYLRYQSEGVPYQPHFVFIGFMSENIRRNVNVFRGFYLPEGQMPLTKPRFDIGPGGLKLLPNPMPRLADYQSLLDSPKTTLESLGRNDDIFAVRYRSGPFDWSPTVRLVKLVKEKLVRRYIGDGIIDGNEYNTSSRAFHVTTGIFDSFYQESIDNNSVPVIVIFPTQSDISTYLKNGTTRYAPLTAYLRSKEYRFVDLMEVLVAGVDDKYGVQDLFVGHYSPMANKIVAKELLEYVSEAEFTRMHE